MLLAGMLGGPRVQFTQDDADNLEVNVGTVAQNEKLVASIEAMPSRLDLDARIIHFAVCQEIVKKWRNKRKAITAWWKLMDAVIEAMVTGDEGTFGPGDMLQTVHHGIVLPNGFVLYYPGLKKSDDGHGYSYMGGHRNKERRHLYGGLITENIVQALSRITITDQWARIHCRFGYRPSLQCHDELVYIVPEVEADLAKHRVLTEMSIPSDWGVGLPLSAEAGYAKTYGAAKS